MLPRHLRPKAGGFASVKSGPMCICCNNEQKMSNNALGTMKPVRCEGGSGVYSLLLLEVTEADKQNKALAGASAGSTGATRTLWRHFLEHVLGLLQGYSGQSFVSDGKEFGTGL